MNIDLRQSTVWRITDEGSYYTHTHITITELNKTDHLEFLDLASE